MALTIQLPIVEGGKEANESGGADQDASPSCPLLLKPDSGFGIWARPAKLPNGPGVKRGCSYAGIISLCVVRLPGNGRQAATQSFPLITGGEETKQQSSTYSSFPLPPRKKKGVCVLGP